MCIRDRVIEGKMISSYGVLDVKPVDSRFGDRLFEIKNMVEKPKPEDAPSNLAIIGRYILTPAIFEDVYKRQASTSSPAGSFIPPSPEPTAPSSI